MTLLKTDDLEGLAGAPPPSRGEPPGGPKGLTLLRRAGDLASAVVAGLVGFGVLVALWALASSRVAELPSPSTTFTTLWDMLSSPFYDNGPNDKGFAVQLAASLTRVFKGFVLAAAVGIPLGLLMGANRWVWRAANPLVQLLRPVSPLAWFPIWLVILKSAPNAAVWVIFITALWPIVLNTAAGAAAIPPDHRNVARVFRFGRLAYARHVLFPDALPSIVTGLRQSMGVAWMVIVAVEMLSGGTGVGFLVWDSYNALNLAKVISAILIIGAVGLIIDFLFLKLGRAVA